MFRTKKINWYLFSGLLFLSITYILSHASLFYSFLFDTGYRSHRLEFHYQDLWSSKEALLSIINIIWKSDYGYTFHVICLQQLIVILVSIILFLMIKQKQINNKFIAILIFILGSSILYGIYHWDSFANIRTAYTQTFPLNISRFNWLHPMCWYILLGISLCYIYRYIKWKNIIICSILVIQLVFVLKNQEYRLSFPQPGFSGFFAEKQFEDVKSFIGKDVSTYKVISVGLHPSIAQYNGFWTLDGYFANYPLDYKHEFYKIIEPEISKNAELYNYFIDWGSRCYAFSAEIGKNLDANYHIKEIEHLDYDFDKLKEMRGQYIISSLKINESNNQRLKLLKIFENYTPSNWIIYLYEVI